MNVRDIKDVKRIFNEDHPKYVCLTDHTGNYIVAWNSPRITAKKRFDEIIKKLTSPNCTDGIYYFKYKDSLNNNAAEYDMAVGKGNYNSQVALKERSNVETVRVHPEEVWTMSKALEINSKLNFLELENQWLKKEIEEQKKYIDELESKQPEEANAKGFGSEIKELLEAAQPVVDKYFEQEDKRLSLAERGVPQKRTQSSVQQREDGGEPFASDNYGQYFHNIYNDTDGELLDYELGEMEKYNPQMYIAYCNHYKINITEEDEQQNAGSAQ